MQDSTILKNLEKKQMDSLKSMVKSTSELSNTRTKVLLDIVNSFGQFIEKQSEKQVLE